MSGKIYLICLNDEPVYVGFTTQSIEQRWVEHIKDSRYRKHALYSAFKKYGVENFTIELIADYIDADYALNVCEEFWIRHLNTHTRCGGYNMTYGGDMPPSRKGKKHSPEARARMSAAAKNRSPEHRAKMSAAAKNPSPEARAKMSAAKKGKVLSPETRARMSASQKLRRKNLKEQLCPHCVDNTAH